MIRISSRPLTDAATSAVYAATLFLAGCSGTSSPAGHEGAADAQAPSIPTIRYLNIDEHGKLKAPEQLQALAQEAKNSGVTDVFIMAHGWNNSASEAKASYETRLARTVEASQLKPELRPQPFKQMFIGLIWPSKAWDFGPTQESAVAPTLTPDQLAALSESFPIASLKDASPTSSDAELEAQRAADLGKITQLAQKAPAETTLEDRQAAFILFRKYSIKPSKLKFPSTDDQNRFDGPVPEGVISLSQGLFPTIGDAARVFTFWQMKMRAGIVGENGGAEILKSIKGTVSGCRVHLLGHSFGSKVVLAAVLAYSKDDPQAKVDTMVLLQGAISYQALADQVGGAPPSTPGGYRDDLKAVKGPIVATFSKFDIPLNKGYPLGAFIGNQTGELEGVSIFSALGAIGFDSVNPITMKDPGTPYGFKREPKLYSIAGSDHIPGHSAISDPAVAWMEWAAIVCD